MSMSVEDVNRVEFGNSPIGRRGYAKDEVDEFVHRVAKTLVDEDDLTAAEVYHVMFSKPIIGKRGYDEREVDDFLEAVVDELANRTGTGRHEVPSAREQSQATRERASADSAATARVEHFQDK